MFITPCDVRVLKGGWVELIRPLGFKYKNIIITLHVGFKWNLADIPHWLQEEIGCPFEFIMESGLHDGLYATGLFNRETSDLYWYLALRSGGRYKQPVGKLKSKALYYGVRVGGESHFRTGSIADARNYVSIEVL